MSPSEVQRCLKLSSDKAVMCYIYIVLIGLSIFLYEVL